MNPSDNSAAPDGVVVTDEMMRAGWNAYLEDMNGGLLRFEKTYRAMLAASPLPAPDERLNGLMWLLQNVAWASPNESIYTIHVKLLEIIRQIEAAQKDQRIKTHGYRGIERRFQPSQGREARRPKAAVGSGGPDSLATLHSSPAAEHCLPVAAKLLVRRFESALHAAVQKDETPHISDAGLRKAWDAVIPHRDALLNALAAPCADGPSEEAVMRAKYIVATPTRWTLEPNILARELLRWHAKKGK